MLKTIAILLAIQLSSAHGRKDIVYAAAYSHERLATRINCQIDESQRFSYSSETALWGSMGGEIVITADVTLHCLGEDKGGKYESQALKYLVQVSNLNLEQKNNSQNADSLSRKKRGIKDFFTDNWRKLKRFFKKMFGGSSEEPQQRTVVKEVVHEKQPEERRESSSEEEEEFNMSDLTHSYSAPFLFVQLANGSIPEIRFSDSETDGRIKNFKRHLVDAFATQLNFNDRKKSVVETSVMGEHASAYNITVDRKSEPLLSLAGLAASPSEIGTDTVVVEKVVTEGDILKLAPNQDNAAFNDREKMALKMQQVQIFQGGRMLASSGASSLVLLYDSEQRSGRVKREDESDVTSYFQAHSAFDMQLKKREKRSTESTARMEQMQKMTFHTSSRLAEVEDDSSRQSLRALQKSITDVTVFFKNLLENHDSDYNENMQLLFEMVEREVSLKLDNDQHSVSKMARKILTKQMMQNMCAQNFTKCKDFLQLLALAGGSKAEEVMLFFLTETNTLSTSDIRTVADIISDTSNPSPSFVTSLSLLIRDSSTVDPEVYGPLVLSTGHLAASFGEDVKRTVSEALVEVLRKHRGRCRSDPILIDVLEAIGNLGHFSTVPSVLRVSEECWREQDVQIASAHALRHSTGLRAVQEWMKDAIGTGNCDLTRAVIGTLLDTINEQETKRETKQWPLYNFNDLDTILQDRLRNSTSARPNCNLEDIILYFSRKRDPKATDFARTYFGTDSEPWSPGSGSRQRRALWDNLNCQEWTEDTKSGPIQDREEFAADRAMYNKRKSCLAFRRLGVKGANAEIYAGMFAGVKEPSEPTKYKLFTKFVSGINFLGRQMEIGSFYFYLQEGKTKAFVRIMDRTRQEFTHEGCTPTDLRYRPVKHIPLYLLSVSAVQLSLGIHLSSQLALDTACPGHEAYQVEPLTSVRIGGEAAGTVLYARGTVNLGGNFNYKLQFTFTPSPNMCLKGSHGYDPMSISFEAYYQLWNSAKQDWGKFRSWKPSFLSWQLRRGSQKTWFDDTCIIQDSSSATKRKPEIEREEK